MDSNISTEANIYKFKLPVYFALKKGKMGKHSGQIQHTKNVNNRVFSFYIFIDVFCQNVLLFERFFYFWITFV